MADNSLQAFWPKITDLESAKKASRGGVAGAIVVVVVTLGFVMWSILAGTPIANVDMFSLVDVILFALIGVGIYRLSRTAAVLGLVLYLVELAFTLKSTAGSLNIVLPIIIILAFVAGLRGTFAYHKFKNAQQFATEDDA